MADPATTRSSSERTTTRVIETRYRHCKLSLSAVRIFKKPGSERARDFLRRRERRGEQALFFLAFRPKRQTALSSAREPPPHIAESFRSWFPVLCLWRLGNRLAPMCERFSATRSEER